MRSTFTLSIPQDFYDAVCGATEQGFADCHLYGARLHGSALTPRTLTAAVSLEQDSRFRQLAQDLGIKVIRPTPYPGEGDRPSAKEAREQGAWS